MTSTYLFIKQSFKMTIMSLKARYRNTFAGFIWVILSPIIVFGAQSIAFKYILNIQVPNYSLFLMSNLLPWIFIMNNIHMGTSILETKATILKSFKTPPLLFVTTQIIDNLINFITSFLILFTASVIFGDTSIHGILFLIPSTIILVIGSFLMCSTLAILNVFYRDLKFIVQFLTSIIFFITPIFYPIEYVPEAYRYLLKFNIFYTLIKPFSLSAYQFDLTQYATAFLEATLVLIVLAIILKLTWRRYRNELYISL